MELSVEVKGAERMNIWDVLILLAVGAALVAAARIAGKKKGGCGCCPVKGTGPCRCAEQTRKNEP